MITKSRTVKKILKLNRFTTLPMLLDLLDRRKLVLLDPCSWDDKNDTEIIEEYKKKAKISNLFALCFTHDGETIHHWKTFANGPGGCCIEFSANRLIQVLDGISGLRHRMVEYKKITEAKSEFELKDIPFIKRKPYQFEREYRVIWEGKTKNAFFEIEITLDLIRRITFSQQMPAPVYEAVKALLIRNFPELKNKINKSTVYRNDVWINHFKK